MKTKSSKLLKVCFVLAALVFFLTAMLFPVTSFSASASDSYDPGPAPEPDPEPEPQLPIYYISDSSASVSIARDIEQKTGGTVHLTQYTPGDTANDQKDALYALWGEVDFSEIEESYVIFEFETPFVAEKSEGQELVPDLLNDIFSTLKANDCYIMFICGTDEYWFRNNNAFLDYVDIHVNTDKIGTFYMSILYQVAQNLGMDFGYTTFFLDKSVAPFIEYGNRYCDFVKFYFVRYIKSVYKEYIQAVQDRKVEDVLNDRYIDILCHVQGDEYFNIVNGATVYLSEYGDYIESRDRCYAVGTNENGEAYSAAWVTDIREACEAQGKKFTVFYYEYEEHGFGESWYEPSEFGTLLTAHGAGSLYLENIMLDFVRGEDMHPYDNWTGRCDITHKIRMSGSGGWLIDMMSSDFSVEGWDLYLTEDDADYYNDENDVWN